MPGFGLGPRSWPWPQARTGPWPQARNLEVLASAPGKDAAADQSANDAVAQKEAALREELRALHKRYEHEEPMAEEQQGRVKAEYRKRHAELEQQLRNATAAGPAGSGVELLALGAAADHSADDAAAQKEDSLREKLHALHKRYEHEEPMAEEQQGRVKAEYRKRHAELEQQLRNATAAAIGSARTAFSEQLGAVGL